MTPSNRNLIAGLAVIAAVAAPWCVRAQNPSSDDIVRSLRPGAGMMGGSRGIRQVPAEAGPAATAPAGAATGAVVRRPAAAAASTPATGSASAPSVNLSVQFATNSADLTPAAIRTLSELGRALSSNTLSAYRFRIEGHTDTAGQPEANRALSERRAQAVVAFLTSTFHVDGAKLEAVGMGQDGLLVQTAPNTPEARNRRVQVVNLGT